MSYIGVRDQKELQNQNMQYNIGAGKLAQFKLDNSDEIMALMKTRIMNLEKSVTVSELKQQHRGCCSPPLIRF